MFSNPNENLMSPTYDISVILQNSSLSENYLLFSRIIAQLTACTRFCSNAVSYLSAYWIILIGLWSRPEIVSKSQFLRSSYSVCLESTPYLIVCYLIGM